MNFIFDLDGPIRSLHHGACRGWVPKTWSEPLPNGEDVCRYIDNNLDVLLESGTTEYYEIINDWRTYHDNILTILTHQPQNWQKNTLKWVKEHFGFYCNVIFVNSPIEKLDYIARCSNTYLVEDYPNFPKWAYEKIILIDYPYNQGIDSFVRVKTPRQLSWILGV